MPVGAAFQGNLVVLLWSSCPEVGIWVSSHQGMTHHMTRDGGGLPPFSHLFLPLTLPQTPGPSPSFLLSDPPSTFGSSRHGEPLGHRGPLMAQALLVTSALRL